MHAINMAVTLVADTDISDVVIMSDFYSVLRALTNVRIEPPAVRRLLHDINDLNREARGVQLRSIPGHVGSRQSKGRPDGRSYSDKARRVYSNVL